VIGMKSAMLVVLAMLVASACSEADRERRRVYAISEPALHLGDLPESAEEERTRGPHVVYVPAYSRLFLDSDQVMQLTVSLSIHNTDDRSPIALTSVRYYTSRGKLVREYLHEGSVELAPMATVTQPVRRADRSGGEGANFIVEWTSAEPVSEPIIETVMASGGMQGFAFVSRGRELPRP
jgi:hypothetical protein